MQVVPINMSAAPHPIPLSPLKISHKKFSPNISNQKFSTKLSPPQLSYPGHPDNPGHHGPSGLVTPLVHVV